MAVLFTSLISAFTGGGAAAGAAAGAAGAAGGIGSTLATIASVGSTIVGGLASISAGKQQQAALNAQADQEDFKAVQETLNGRQEALTAMRKLNTDLSNVTVAGFASGLTSEGSVSAAQDEAIKTGEANINMARDNAQMAAASRRQQGAQLRAEGRAARSAGLMSALQGGLSLFSRKTARG